MNCWRGNLNFLKTGSCTQAQLFNKTMLMAITTLTKKVFSQEGLQSRSDCYIAITDTHVTPNRRQGQIV